MTDDEIAKLCDKATTVETDDGDGPTCSLCRDTYTMETGHDRTPLCDNCAHLVVDRLAEAALELLARAQWSEAESDREHALRLAAEASDLRARDLNAGWAKTAAEELAAADALRQRLAAVTRARDELAEYAEAMHHVLTNVVVVDDLEAIDRLRAVGKDTSQ